MKEYSVISSAVNKSEKKPKEPEEQIKIEPAVAIVKDLVTENVEDGHIIFCEDASNIVSHPNKPKQVSVPMLSVRIGDHCYYGLCDIGASVSAIPYELYTEIMHEIDSCELEDIDVVIQLANRETISPIGIVRDVEVLCGKIKYPADFLVLGSAASDHCPIIFGRPFLNTCGAIIDCKKEKILTRFAGEPYEFNFSKFTKTPYKADLPSNDFKMEQCASIVLVPNNPLQQHLENSESEAFRKERDELEEIFLRQLILKHDLPVEDLGTTPPPKEDPVFDLKPLPDNLKYAHIDDKKIYPVIISSKLSEIEEERLLEILKKHRGAIGYTLDDLKGISPSICQHAINMEDDAKPVVEHQRRLIPKMKEVVRNEVLKLLEAGIIYPIADSRWVSPVHCVPKKGGMTVVPNDNDELIPKLVNHGFKACVKCMDKTPHLQLPKAPGSCKTVFQGTRMWLRFDHPWRKRKDLFNGEEELGRAPRPRSGEEISELLENWEECPAPGKKRPRESPLLGVWKARSVFWDLPYWKVLHTPHSLDVMHITKNVTESLLGTLMNMPERTKDGPKARTDLKLLGLKKELQYPTDSDDDDDEQTETTQGRHKRAKKNEVVVLKPACFTLSEEELERFFECLLGVKVPHGYSGKISRYLDVAKKRFSGMKSHDCHVLMTQILPVAMRGIMDDHVRETLFGLCNFFDVISRKSIGVKQLNRLQEEIVEILCELEIYFPPAFFDIMVHLLVHVVDDIIHLGPTFLHNMMPFERLNGVIKGFVRNRARPDGSIAKGFLTYECISFCQNYLSTENEDVGLPTRKHVGRLAGFGHREGYRAMHVGIAGRHADFDRAHRVALQHIELVSPWVDKHKSLIEQKFIDLGRPRKTGDVTKEHNSTFTGWFKKRLLESPAPMPSTEEQKLIFSLSQGPGHNVRTYQSYDINGYRFYTEEKDKNSEYQNSGVTMLSYTDDKTDVKERFYGRIEEIWELDYVGVTMPMFRVRWAKSVEKDGLYFTTMVIPDAKSKTPSAKNEPWVLASQVDQCFFITDPSKPSRVVVRRGKRSIIGMEGEADKQDIDKNGDPKIEEEFDKYFDKPTTYSKVRRKTTLPAKGCPYTRRNLKVAGLKYSTTAMKKGKNIVKKR
ncbi:hypothetical protein QYE76_004928 [Lolium multiflorum]|uniref:DUF4218 domain-containing protein n=1 Tax=Lolium multiflorum TaxID=4521 RepID=A0AAD8RRN1_LOLMU|nr:hypothetical protein QYE76_004928 [Lolium multiflorum]